MAGLLVVELGIGLAVGLAVGWLRSAGLPPPRLRRPRPVPGRLGHRGGALIRPRRRRARVGAARRLPHRDGSRQRAHPREALGRHLPRGPRLGRAAVDVPDARPAGVPVGVRRGLARGHGPGPGARAGRPSRRDLPDHARARASRSPERTMLGLGRPARGDPGGVRDLRRAPRGSSDGVEMFNIVFFAVLALDGAPGDHASSPSRGCCGSPPAARPCRSPLAETGTIRSLGAEVIEYPVAPGDAAAGARVRDLGLPRDALVNVIVRGDRALPPRGSTRVEAGDRLHVVVTPAGRVRARRTARALAGRAARAPLRGSRPRLRGGLPVFMVRRWEAGDGDPVDPHAVVGGG